MKHRRRFAFSTLGAVALALAGCQTLPPPPGEYKFELIGTPTVVDHRTTVSVSLVRTDESPVVGAQVYAEHWVTGGPKTAPNHVQLEALSADSKGRFAYSSDTLREGDTLHLAARIQPGTSLIHGSVIVP
jgi:hypothetical protein